jgi:hypothetical protein
MTKEEKLFIATGEKIKGAKVRCLEKPALKSMEKHLHASLKTKFCKCVYEIHERPLLIYLD